MSGLLRQKDEAETALVLAGEEWLEWRVGGADHFVLVVFLVGLILGAELFRRWSRKFGSSGNSEEKLRSGARGAGELFDCGRGRYLPPPASGSGARYYALKARECGLVGVYAGWSKFKAAWKGGQKPDQGSFIGTVDLEEAFAFIGRAHPEQNQGKLYF